MVSRYEERSKMREKSRGKWYYKIFKNSKGREDNNIESYKIEGDTKFVTTILVLFFFVIIGVWVWVLSEVYFQ